jgi:hypothetical protein
LDQPNLEEVRIHVQANVLPDLTITPGSVNFGKIKKGSTPEKSVLISWAGQGHGPLEKANSESGYVNVKSATVAGNAGQESYRVTAKINPDLPVGHWYCTLWIASANANQPPINIPMTVEVVP